MRNLKSSREKNKYKKIGILFCIVCIVAGICFLILNLNNYLDRLAENMNGPDCSCKIKVLEKAENSNDEDTGASENSFFIYREKKESFQYDYHVMALDASGKEKKLFTLREDGMDLDRAPKLIYGKDKLYVLFEGIDKDLITSLASDSNFDVFGIVERDEIFAVNVILYTILQELQMILFY